MIKAFKLKFKDYDYVPDDEERASSTEAVTANVQDNDTVDEPMMEIELSSTDSSKLMDLLSVNAELMDLMESDPDEEQEMAEVIATLDESYLNVPRITSASAVDENDNTLTYHMTSKLRASCLAHNLQLVVNDGLDAVDVSQQVLNWYFTFSNSFGLFISGASRSGNQKSQ